jgi:hypothetical protein
MDTRKTTLMKIVTVRENDLANLLRKICREVQNQVWKDMALPSDMPSRLVAINTINNVFDRIDAELEQRVKTANGAVPIIAEGVVDE